MSSGIQGGPFPHLLPALLVTGHRAVIGLWPYHSHGCTMASWLCLPSAFPLLRTAVRLDGATLLHELTLTRCLQRGRSWKLGMSLEPVPPSWHPSSCFHQGDLQAWMHQSQISVPTPLSPHTVRGIPFSLPPLTSISALLARGSLHKEPSLGVREPSQIKRKPLSSAF